MTVIDIPARYSAEWHYAGCLPDTDVLLWDSPREAWLDLIERLDDSDLMWESEEDTSGKHPWDRVFNKTEFARTLARMADDNEPGTVSGPDGYLYSVEDTHTMRCGYEPCGMTYPDIYPAGRCPYEANHELYRVMHAVIIAVTVFSREEGAR